MSQTGLKSVLRAVIALAVIATSARAEQIGDGDIASYTGYVPQSVPTGRKRPVEQRMEVSLRLCREYRSTRFASWIYEVEALDKAYGYGWKTLDSDELKWVSAVENRRSACLSLLERAGEDDSVVGRLRSWIRSH